MKEPVSTPFHKEKSYEQTVVKRYRNYRMLLYASLLGISFMFISLLFMYFTTSRYNSSISISLPPLFYFNTILLVAGSFSIILAQNYYKDDALAAYKKALLAFSVCGLLFFAGQVLGWYLLFQNGYPLSHLGASYLYMLSGMHLLHTLGGLVFLTWFLVKNKTLLEDYAISVVYFTDPVVKLQLNLFGLYWHFIAILWVLLLLSFMVI